ncbi:MAG: hypothetical protein ACI4PF_01085 [Christensenellales bacterium]
MADGYSAGNLEFVVQTISDSTLASLDKLNAKLKTTMSLLGAMPSLTRNMGTITRTTARTSVGGSPFDNKQLKVSALSLTKMLNKVYFLRSYTKQMFASISGIVEKAVDYTETLNLWQVAMRQNRTEAEQFINTMNKAYGISTQTLMNYQAIFRNMLSSLGGISEMTSYALSEFLTQMALDYASLYNTSIEKAMTTFQAVLSGQVRPIRSIAGYDITETTIFQLYQQLGGTKTMRQLTQTEKRLLRIYAVFQQMEASGAIGDLAKTLDNTANQMRIFTESTKELGTWLGILLEATIKPILPYLNAFVITLTNIVKAIVKVKGIEMFEGGIESVQELNEELDKTTGKLLSFDRFEALNSTAGEDTFGIDENLLAGLSKYQSILDGVTGKAQELAKAWTDWFVKYDAEGNIVGLTNKAQLLVDVLKSLAITLSVLLGYNLITKIGKLLGKIIGLINKTRLLNFTIATGVVFVILKMVEAFKKGDTAGGILIGTLSIGLVSAFKLLNVAIKGNIRVFESSAFSINAVLTGVTLLASGILSLVGAWGNMGTWQKAITIFSALAAAIAAAAVALHIFKGNWVAALGIGAAIAGTVLLVGSTLAANTVPKFKNGGQVEDGLFTMSKGEIIGNFDDGTTVVANNQQIIQGIQQGVYSAVVSGMRQVGGAGGVGNVYLNGRKVGIATAKPSHKEMVRTNMIKANS